MTIIHKKFLLFQMTRGRHLGILHILHTRSIMHTIIYETCFKAIQKYLSLSLHVPSSSRRLSKMVSIPCSSLLCLASENFFVPLHFLISSVHLPLCLFLPQFPATHPKILAVHIGFSLRKTRPLNNVTYKRMEVLIKYYFSDF